MANTAPIIYTEKEDGVLPAYNIRTDRFDIAMDAYDKMTRNSAKKATAPVGIRRLKRSGFEGTTAIGWANKNAEIPVTEVAPPAVESCPSGPAPETMLAPDGSVSATG